MIKKIPLAQIKPNPSNPRTIRDDKFKKLVQSLLSFPDMARVRPIVVNKDMVILGGNMRYKAMQEAGWSECHVEVVDWPEDQQKEFIIKDNVGFGDWDWDELTSDWNAVDLEAWGLDVPVFDKDAEAEAKEDDYDISEALDTDIVLGDIFEIGEHRLLCGSATQTDSFEKLMKGEMADMVITDPPYNVNYEGGNGLKIENDNMSNDEFYRFLYDFYSALSTACKKGAAIYVWHASSEVINFAKAMVDAGWLLKQQLIWVKNQLVMGRQDYHWKHEPCLYGWLPGGSHKWYADRKQTTVIEWDKPQKNREHPTMKPIGLLAYQIQNSSKAGDIVIDCFGGSGTTMVACHQIKRRSRIIELDPNYCQVIVDRMLKLDPTLQIKRNGQIYKKQESNRDAEENA
jgi:DNA modification methylase